VPGPESLRKLAAALKADEAYLLRLAGHLEEPPRQVSRPEVLHLAQQIEDLLDHLKPEAQGAAFEAVESTVNSWRRLVDLGITNIRVSSTSVSRTTDITDRVFWHALSRFLRLPLAERQDFLHRFAEAARHGGESIAGTAFLDELITEEGKAQLFHELKMEEEFGSGVAINPTMDLYQQIATVEEGGTGGADDEEAAMIARVKRMIEEEGSMGAQGKDDPAAIEGLAKTIVLAMRKKEQERREREEREKQRQQGPTKDQADS
jgi:hypothetical protein